MPLKLQVSEEPNVSGLPEGPLQMLAEVVQSQAGDLAMLHPADGSGMSILAVDPLCRIHVNADGGCSVTATADLGKKAGDASLWTLPADIKPLAALERIVGEIQFEASHPWIGWIGFISYDIGRTLEPIPAVAPDELRWPLIHFTLFRHYLAFDGTGRRLFAGELGGGQTSDRWMWPKASGLYSLPSAGKAAVLAGRDRGDFVARVRRVQEYIAAGDIYQANIAQRWTLESEDAPEAIFSRLCAISPAPRAAFLRMTDDRNITRHVLSASPELAIAGIKGHIFAKPIKGTRPRDLADARRDLALREELLHSTKDRAELAMIVDLLRNDLGRIARYGTVRVTEPRAIERHPTVWHTVASIEAQMRPEVGLGELLAALCPGGSVTGAPKIRAMQIIEEMEPFRRGLYCGNIGMIGPQASFLSLNIAIRTILMQDRRAYLYAGGGIVADSVPDMEYEETLHKAAALFRAFGLEPPN